MSDDVQSCPRCGTQLQELGPTRLCPACLAKACLDTLAEPATSTDLPRRFGEFEDYELIEEVGRGGMGIIFKARQASLNRTVALKVIAGGLLASPESVERFRTEAEAVARLEHPNIVPIYEVGESQGQPFYTMRLVDGRTLAQEMKAVGAFPTHRAGELVATIARAVHYAHQRGILHRDLKPANILLDGAGVPHVADFGLARVMEEDSSLTLSNTALGTPAYMAPEQAGSVGVRVTTAADIYSLGAILFELVTGRVLFAGATPLEIIVQAREREPDRPSRLNPSVDRDLETICLKCLQKEPERRYGSAELLAEDLERWVRKEPIHARPVPLHEKAWLWCRRKPALAGLAGAFVLTVVVGTSLALWRIAVARQREQLEQYYSSIAVADHHLSHGEVDRALEVLYRCPEGFRRWEWGHLIYRCHQEARSFPAHTNVVHSFWMHIVQVAGVAFDGHGRYVGSVGRNGIAQVREIESGRTVLILGTNGVPPTTLAFSPTRDELAVGFANGEVRVWQEFSGQGELVATLGDRHQPAVVEVGTNAGPTLVAVEHLAFSPDGTKAAASTRDGRVKVWATGGDGAARQRSVDSEPGKEQRLFQISEARGAVERLFFTSDSAALVVKDSWAARPYDASGGRPLALLQPGSTNAAYFGVSSDLSVVVSVDNDLRFRLWRGGGQMVELGELKAEIFSFEWPCFFSDDSAWVCTSGEEGSAQVFDAATGEERFSIPHRVKRAVFSPDSSLLATIGGENVVRLWDVGLRREVLVLSGHGAIVEQMAFSRDGRWIATSDREGMVKVWRSDPGRTRIQREVSAWACAYSPKGDRLALSPFDETLEIIDRESGALIRKIDMPFHFVESVAFSPNGRRVVTGGSGREGRVWDIETGKEVFTLRGHERSIPNVAWSPNGRWIATGSFDSTAIVWDATNGALRYRLVGASNAVYHVAFSPDNRLLATAALDATVRVWEVASGQLRYVVPTGPTDGPDAQFTQDGRYLVTTGGRAIRWWDARDGRRVREWPANKGTTTFQLSPDGDRMIVISSEGGQISYGYPKLDVLDLRTGQRLLSLVGHKEFPFGLHFDGEGRRLLSCDFAAVTLQSETFPWRDAEYPADDRRGLAERVRAYADRYWWQRSQAEQRSVWPLEPSTSAPRRADRSLWPSRDPGAGPDQVDLTEHYTGLLDRMFAVHKSDFWFDVHLAGLPTGLVELGGVRFDVRGVVQLGKVSLHNSTDRELWRRMPKERTGIHVGRSFRRIHVLHAVADCYDAVEDGVKVGIYRLRYVDGDERELEIRHGVDLRDWLVLAGGSGLPATKARVVWSAPAEILDPPMRRLFLRTYENPRPEVEVKSMDFVSEMGKAAPFLVAVTVED